MGLELNTIVGKGRKPTPTSADVVRELGAADIALLAAGAEAPTKPPPLTKITERHHAVARLLASGMPPGEVAAVTGYDNARISILQGSPAFQELVALYHREVDIEFASVLNNLAGLSKDAIMALRERLEEEPENFTIKDLRETAELALDRTGHPKSRDINTTVTLDLSSRLEAARKRARAAAAGEVEDAEIIEDQE